MKKFLRKAIALVLLGTMVLPSVVSADSGSRLFGSNRYATNYAVVDDVMESAEIVVLASGQKFPDALSAYNFSKVMDAPIILMDKTSDYTYDLLDKLGTKDILMVGGPNTLSPEFEAELSKHYQVTRVFGEDRYETSEFSYELTKEFFNEDPVPIITTGEYFQEPLIATTFASYLNEPLLLRRGVPRYSLQYGDGVLMASNISDYNDEVLDMTEGEDYVLAQVESFPDTLSAVNYILWEGFKIKLVPSVKATDDYTRIVGGPNTLKMED